MPGFDDSRYLQQVITDLQKRVRTLEATTVPHGINQIGPFAGYTRSTTLEAATVYASKLLPPIGTTGPQGSFDLSGSVPGTSPILKINDGTRDRVQIGNLAVYTDPGGVLSPAMYGGRAVDATGNLIWDTAGVSAVMKSLGVMDVVNQTFTTTTFTTVTGSGVAFTTTRQLNLLCLFLATGNVTTNNGNVGFIRARLVGGPGTTSGNLNFGVLANFAQTSSGWLFLPALAAGSYTVQLDGAVNATPQTFNMIEAALQIFQLGA